MKLRRLLLGRKVMTNLGSILKSRDITLPTKVHLVKAMVFPVVMYWCESWTIKKAEHWRIDAFEWWCWRARRDCKEIQPVHPKGDQSWVFIGRTDAETPILWPPDMKSWLIWKYPDAGRDWGQEEKGTTEDEMIGWHHRLSGHELEWTPGVGDGQGGLACCSPWGRKESDTTEQLNWTELRLLNCEATGELCLGWGLETSSLRISRAERKREILSLILSLNSEAHFQSLVRVHARSLQLCPTLCDPVAYQAPLSMGFSRQEYCSGSPCTFPGDLPNLWPGGIELQSLTSPALVGRFFTFRASREAHSVPYPLVKAKNSIQKVLSW